jgi:RES domain
MQRSMLEAVARCPVTDVTGDWQRHVAWKIRNRAAEGRAAYGRWGDGDYPVLYLGRPADSVVVEAYRHLIDPIIDPEIGPPPLQPRALVTIRVQASQVLDLTRASSRHDSGLSLQQLQSEIDDEDSYAACHAVSRAAHQLNLHGIVAPAATRLGETLALFPNNLPAAEVPRAVGEPQLWTSLPADPREQSGNVLRLHRRS